MRHLLLILAILISSLSFSQEIIKSLENPIAECCVDDTFSIGKNIYSLQSDSNFPTNSVCIGYRAGGLLTRETLCVIVGSSYEHQSIRGKDMLWLVDWCEPYLNLNPAIKSLLQNYYINNIMNGKDTRANRKVLVDTIRNTIGCNGFIIGLHSGRIGRDTIDRATNLGNGKTMFIGTWQ